MLTTIKNTNVNVTELTPTQYGMNNYWYRALNLLRQNPVGNWQNEVDAMFKMLEDSKNEAMICEAFSNLMITFCYELKVKGKAEKANLLIARIHEVTQQKVKNECFLTIINLNLASAYIDANDVSSAMRIIKILSAVLDVQNTNFIRLTEIIRNFSSEGKLAGDIKKEFLLAISILLARLEKIPLKTSFPWFKNLLFDIPNCKEYFFMIANQFKKLTKMLPSFEDENYPKDFYFYRGLAEMYIEYFETEEAKHVLKIALVIALSDVQTYLEDINSIYDNLKLLHATSPKYSHLFSMASVAFSNSSANITAPIDYKTLVCDNLNEIDEYFLFHLRLFYQLLSEAFSKCEVESLQKVINEDLFKAIQSDNIGLKNLIELIPKVNLRKLTESSPSTSIALTNKLFDLETRYKILKGEVAALENKLELQEREIALLNSKIKQSVAESTATNTGSPLGSVVGSGSSLFLKQQPTTQTEPTVIKP